MHHDRWLLTTGEDQAIRIWDMATKKMLHEVKAETMVTAQSDVGPDGRLLLTGAGWRVGGKGREEDRDFALRLWHLPAPP